MPSAETAPAPTGLTDRALNWVERAGNKLPEPFMLFLILFALTGVVSTGMAWAGITVSVPGAEEPTVIKGLFTGEGLTWLTTNLGANYIGFPPLVTVMPILLAIGIAQHSGLLGAAIRKLFGSSPAWALPYVVGFVGVISSIMADSAFVVVPPLAALVFKAAGRHPMAGLLGGFAAAGAGYSTNIFPTSLDALFAGITTSVMGALPGYEFTAVNPVSNWFFNIVASLILGFVAGFIIDRLVEPRMVRMGVSRDEIAAEGEDEATADDAEQMRAELTPAENKGLLVAVLGAVLLTAVFLVAFLMPESPWRNEEGGFLPRSPLLSSIVFIVVAYFAVVGIAYGAVVGTIRSSRDAVRMMSDAIKEMLPFVVLAFILGNFIALFNWSGIGTWIAVTGASALEASGLDGFAAVLGFILLASCLNLFIISGSGMWAIMGAVFVPMFALIGYEPAFTQAAFRVGDSATQVITPMNPYMIVLLGMVRKYEPGAGFGTLMARMLPFVVPFWLVWTLILAVFFFADLPLGPGNGIFLG
ncbi:AbgT family transporter [Brachybacterium saurashtrense]|uniref:AbgT family transporter n=1 Tax=Brachybacterium saurashtrense TaxID=556288 RepID=A0A345YQR5_9MICO|nr:AbgT family transporter [Brachybacterium saurashtrense]AXK46267.1 AbgT family transporter [Brachybacterium saurashtrense]RRR24007.1 AbgT family transporter [Brachybacterium saurashtrense]